MLPNRQQRGRVDEPERLHVQRVAVQWSLKIRRTGLAAIWLVPCWLPVALCAADLNITYLANEGVMIDCRGEKVLVDALFRDSLDSYTRHSPEVQEKMETGKPPFDSVDLALATHFHLDHWDAGAITRFLGSNPHAVFASTPTATAMLPWSQHEREHALWPAEGQRERLQVGSVSVQAFRLTHGNTQNLGYRIAMCGETLVHLGDAEVSDADMTVLLQLGAPDVAMVPYWWLLDPRGTDFISRKWKPRYLVVLHSDQPTSTQPKKFRQSGRRHGWPPSRARPGPSDGASEGPTWEPACKLLAHDFRTNGPAGMCFRISGVRFLRSNAVGHIARKTLRH